MLNYRVSRPICVVLGIRSLEGEEQQESHHKTEQTHGFRQGETQDSVGEQLLLQRWVSCVTDDQRSEYCSDSGTRSGNTNGSCAGSDELGSRIDVTGDRGSLE